MEKSFEILSVKMSGDPVNHEACHSNPGALMEATPQLFFSVDPEPPTGHSQTVQNKLFIRFLSPLHLRSGS